MASENPSNYTPDFEKIEIKKFFEFLSGHYNSIQTVAFLDSNSKGVIQGYGVYTETIDNICKLAHTLHQNSGATLHVTLNETNGLGRKTNNIIGTRVLCVDLDRKVEKVELSDIVRTFKVHGVVCSSPNKYHLYWKISGIALTDWSNYQLGLAQYFRGDKNLRTLCKTIRVPGIKRECKDGSFYTPKLLNFECTHKPLNYDSILELFPWVMSECEKGRQSLKIEGREVAQALRQLRKEGLKVNGQAGTLNVSEGGRNVSLFSAVKAYVVKEGCNEQDAHTYGLTVNQLFSVPLDAEEVSKTVRSAYTAGLEVRAKKEAHKKEMEEKLSEIKEIRSETPGQDSIITPFSYDLSVPFLDINSYTDVALAERVLQKHGENLIRVKPIRVFAFESADYTWKHQSSEYSGVIRDFVLNVLHDVIHEDTFLGRCKDKTGQFSVEKYEALCERFLGSRLIFNLIKDIKNTTKINELSFNEFDVVSENLLCANGLLNMQTKELRPPKSTDYLLNHTSIIFDKDAKCPQFLKFLEEIFANNDSPKEMIKFTQQMFAYSLSGSIAEQKLFCHSGVACNGKSKLLSALNLLAGGYSTYIDPDEIVKTKGGFVKSFERFGSKIEGKRIAIVDDIDSQTIWNEAFVKNATSPVIRARAEHEKSREIKNRTKVHLGLNKTPDIESESMGILRRLCIIPYRRQFQADADKDKALDEMIAGEASGILNWAIEAYDEGISYPEETRIETQKYKESHFTIDTALEELYEVSTDETKFEWLSDIVLDLKEYAANEGRECVISNEVIGHAIKRKFNIDAVKKWHTEKKNTFRIVALKRKEERGSKSNTLVDEIS